MRRYQIVWAVVMLMGAITGYARDGFVEVTHRDLLDYPQKYWSQSIIFDDELLTPPQGQSISIASKRYQSFKTVNLGLCYAEEDIVEELRNAELNVHYLFQGTVLHQASSFFSRSPSFFVVIQKFTRMVNVPGQIQDVFSSQNTSSPLSPNTDAVIKRVQQDLISFARQNNVQISDLFAPGYTNFAAVQNMIYSGIAAVEQQYNTTARQLLGDFMAGVFQSEFSASVEPAAPGDTSAPTVTTPNPTPVPTPVITAETQPQPVATPVDEADRSAALRQRAALMLKPGIRPAGSASTPTPPTPAPEQSPAQ